MQRTVCNVWFMNIVKTNFNSDHDCVNHNKNIHMCKPEFQLRRGKILLNFYVLNTFICISDYYCIGI